MTFCVRETSEIDEVLTSIGSLLTSAMCQANTGTTADLADIRRLVQSRQLSTKAANIAIEEIRRSLSAAERQFKAA